MFTPIQIILVCAWMWGFTVIGMSVQLFSYGVAVLHGFVTGLIMGDVATGGYGGSSVPDYAMGTVVGTVFAIATGGGVEAGLATGIPVATLGTQFDILAKMCGSFFIHKQMDCVEKHQFDKMGIWAHGWNIFRATLYTLPILLVMTVGSGIITTLLANMPVWLTKGLNTAAGMLPAVGFAILMKYLPIREYGVFMIFGFAAASYLGLSMVAISMFAFVAAYMVYKGLEKGNTAAAAGNGGNYDE